MPKPKRDLNSLIASSQPDRPRVNRGQGFQLSTTNPDADIENKAPPAPAPEPKLKPPTIQRESAKVDKELIKRFKKIAVDQDRNLYEVMEEALHYWLQFHNSTKE